MAAVAMGVSACAADDGTSGSGVKVYGILTTQSSSFGFPEMADAMQARVDAVNAAGGVKGQKIDLTICNDQGDVNIAAQCAQKAVTDHAVAVTGGLTFQTAAIIGVLDRAGIPYIGVNPSTPTDYTSKSVFNIGGGSPVAYPALGQALAEKFHCRKIDTIATMTPTGQSNATLVASGAGNSAGKTFSTPAVTTDFAPVVDSVVSDGADCVTLLMGPQLAVKAIPVLRQSSSTIRIGANASGISPSMIKDLGDSVNGTVLVDSFFPVSSDAPGVVAFNEEMKQYKPSTEINTLTLQGWSSASLLVKVLEGLDGAPTAESVTAALNAMGPVDLGTTNPELSFKSPLDSKTYPRIVNTKYAVEEVRDGKSTLVSPDWSDVHDRLIAQ
ncbi:ABC transporter substrate-binding protein [Rhodococcus sp. T2V]|uniref:ABC transporter substrate-binding protein n=1 Tax=Rhodococcus sp. T2V TaxID=3034164 RepID=UPI0023E1157A|nr:ABC transporter substrate-binding protein [Rhodococcus sp. T2V]MDF3313221.1 ABC transporter substrate-binding protein [Rhodococcus sp. T2V]